MSLRGAIRRLRSGTYTFTREAAATGDGHGRDIAGGTTTFPNIACSIQPLAGKDAIDASEGKYSNDIVRGWVAGADFVPIALDEVTGTQPDTLVYHGKVYQVIKVRTWESFNDSHSIFDAAFTGRVAA